MVKLALLLGLCADALQKVAAKIICPAVRFEIFAAMCISTQLSWFPALAFPKIIAHFAFKSLLQVAIVLNSPRRSITGINQNRIRVIVSLLFLCDLNLWSAGCRNGLMDLFAFLGDLASILLPTLVNRLRQNVKLFNGQHIYLRCRLCY